MGMIYDPIQGVGIIPQVTQDTGVDPYSLQNDDITPMIFGNTTLAGTNVNQTGSYTNLLQPFFDYIANAPITFSYTDASPNSTETRSVFDIGKVLTMRGISFFVSISNGTAGYGNMTYYLGFSNDNINYVEEAGYTPAHNASTQFHEFTLTAKRFRYMRIRIAWTAGASTPIATSFLKMQMFIDPNQLFSTRAY